MNIDKNPMPGVSDTNQSINLPLVRDVPFTTTDARPKILPVADFYTNNDVSTFCRTNDQFTKLYLSIVAIEDTLINYFNDVNSLYPEVRSLFTKAERELLEVPCISAKDFNFGETRCKVKKICAEIGSLFGEAQALESRTLMFKKIHQAHGASESLAKSVEKINEDFKSIEFRVGLLQKESVVVMQSLVNKNNKLLDVKKLALEKRQTFLNGSPLVLCKLYYTLISRTTINIDIIRKCTTTALDSSLTLDWDEMQNFVNERMALIHDTSDYVWKCYNNNPEVKALIADNPAFDLYGNMFDMINLLGLKKFNISDFKLSANRVMSNSAPIKVLDTALANLKIMSESAKTEVVKHEKLLKEKSLLRSSS